MALADDYADWIVKNAAKKGTPEFDTVAKAYQDSLSSSRSVLDRTHADADADKTRQGALSDSALVNAVAGYGAAVPRMLRGIGQRVGLVSQASADEANARDKPLLNNFAGGSGNLLGTMVAASPTAAIPGVNTLAGAALTGGALSYTQPTSTGESADRNAAYGGVAGPAGILGGRLLGAGYQGGKALLEPFFDAGQQRIAGRVIQRSAEDPSKIAGISSAPTLTGARPTLAEQTGDRGLASLQDALLANPQTKNALSARLTENNAARVNALRGLTGEDGARDAAVAARSDTAKRLYGDAFANDGALTPSQIKAQSGLMGGGKIDSLLQTPAIADAREAAKTIAANNGTPVNDPAGSIQGLHYMKLAMDDAIAAAKAKGSPAGDNLANSINTAQGKLVDALETLSPGYKAARSTFAQMSQPINSMDVAATVAKKALSNGSDLTGTPTINRNALMGALKDEQALVKQATGRSLGALGNVMAPGDETMLRAIAAEADRVGAVSSAGTGRGSATAERLATQNLLSQTLGPLGVPKGVADNALMQTAAKPLNLIYGGVVEPKIQQKLAEAMLDPVKAQAMVAAATPATRSALVALFQRTAAARAAPAVNALANRP